MPERAVGLYRTCMMIGHFQRAIWPLTVAAALFGFALIEHPWGKPRRFLSLLYATVPFSLHVALYVGRTMWVTSPDTIFIGGVGEILTAGCLLLTFASMFLTHWHGQRYERCLGALNEIDETLKKLGMETNYSKLRRVVVVSLIAWASWSCLLNSVDTTVMVDEMGLAFAIVFPLLVDTPFHLPMLVNMHFWCIVGYAGTRFDCVNNLLKKLMFNDNDSIGGLQNDQTTPVPKGFIADEKTKRTIWTIMHLHFQLCQTLRDMHRIFEIQISIQMPFCCIYILCSIIFTFRMLLLPFDGDTFHIAFMIWIWTVAFGGNIFITNQLCESVGAKATDVAQTTVQLLCLMDDTKLCEDVSLVLLQTKHHPLRFSNLGMCDFGHGYVLETVSSMVTMVTIILQLKTGLEAYKV